MSTTGAPTPAANAGDFLASVLPWPSDDDKGYINVHYAGIGKAGNKWMSGKPTRTLCQPRFEFALKPAV